MRERTFSHFYSEDGLALPLDTVRLPRRSSHISRNVLFAISKTKSWCASLINLELNFRLTIHTAKSLSLAPYFPPHTQRDIYLSLLHLNDPNDKTATKVPDSVLRAALLERAQEDITRIIEIRTRKQALSQLLQRGIVGDEIWQRLLRAEQEMEVEVKDVVQEVLLP